ncbi:MAG TPA: Maf family protein [Dehalococcoidia bacterium]|nr:Maf family protein [Dehalococcoidia bacterium]
MNEYPAGPRLVLASASPRRRELLSQLGISFAVSPSEVEENVPSSGRPERIARRLARAKAQASVRVNSTAWVLAADTVVSYRGRLLGKPRSAREAQEMLRLLRGRRHAVVTAIVLAGPLGRRVMLAHARTTVHMREYTEQEIADYIASGDPFDKAGAYAIQAERFQPVAAYQGCYCNVVGLPLWLTVRLLGRVAFPLPIPDRLVLPPVCSVCPFAS